MLHRSPDDVLQKIQMLHRLPDDVLQKIHALVLNEKHIVARLLLKRATFFLFSAMNKRCFVAHMEEDLDEALSTWQGIVALACYDDTIARSALTHHDCWLQTLQDPYDMRACSAAVMDKFTYELEPILRIAGSSLLARSNGARTEEFEGGET